MFATAPFVSTVPASVTVPVPMPIIVTVPPAPAPVVSIESAASRLTSVEPVSETLPPFVMTPALMSIVAVVIIRLMPGPNVVIELVFSNSVVPVPAV